MLFITSSYLIHLNISTYFRSIQFPFFFFLSKMGLFMKSVPVLIFLLAFVNCVAADTRYIGPTIGGIVALVSKKKFFSICKI